MLATHLVDITPLSKDLDERGYPVIAQSMTLTASSGLRNMAKLHSFGLCNSEDSAIALRRTQARASRSIQSSASAAV